MNGDGHPIRTRRWCGGFIGEFKLIWKAEWIPVQKYHQGKKIDMIFPTAEAAENAAWRTKHKIETPHITGWIGRMSGAKATAEALFRKEPV